ncbi:MAG: response regulator [Pseudomonadota bacterium]
MDEAPHILIVDDHRDIREALAKYLRKNGLRASVAANSVEARDAIDTHAFDLVVLDIMMPGEDGLSLCRDLTVRDAMPVVMLTAMAEETDRIVGLEIGADDYITKPFNPRELLARIRAVLRRTHSMPAMKDVEIGTKYRFDRWFFDANRRELIDESEVVTPLSNGEFELLLALVRHAGRVLSRDQLLDLTRGRGAKLFDRAIDNQILRLRKKIEADPKNPSLIQTVRGGGYRLARHVEEL